MAGVLADAGWALVGLAAVILAASAWLLVWRKGFKRVEARLKDMSVTLEGVDKAVNRKAPHEPHLKDRVARVESDVAAICAHLGIDRHAPTTGDPR